MTTSIELLAAHHALYSALARWQPASACAEDIELARPHLAPVLTWSRIVNDRDGVLSHAELRCATFAIELLAGSIVEHGFNVHPDYSIFNRTSGKLVVRFSD